LSNDIETNSNNDGESSIIYSNGDHTKEHTVTSDSFKSDSTVIDANNFENTKWVVQSISIDTRTIINIKLVCANAHSLIQCDVKFDSNIILASELSNNKVRFVRHLNECGSIIAIISRKCLQCDAVWIFWRENNTIHAVVALETIVSVSFLLVSYTRLPLY
jgi:hypothetical protein